MRKWCEFILKDWRKRVKIKHRRWALLKALHDHQKVWEGGVQGHGQSADQSTDQWNLIQRSKDSLLGDQMTAI